MKLIKSLFAIGALAVAAAAPVAQAAIGDVYSTLFQGVTFSFTQTDANTLSFEMSGSLTGDWSTANSLGAFSLNDLGIADPSGATATLGATVYSGLNKQLSASSVDCASQSDPTGFICFDINPDLLLTDPFDLTFTIDFTSNLAITNPTGPHLKIAFTNADGCVSNPQPGQIDCASKVGTLYSQNIPLSSSSSSTSGGTPGSGSGNAPEPGTSALALLGLGLLGASFAARKARRS